MSDTKILSAIKALHERFVEEPTWRRAAHIVQFILDSSDDLTPPSWWILHRYARAMQGCVTNPPSPASIAYLNEVAKECLG